MAPKTIKFSSTQVHDEVEVEEDIDDVVVLRKNSTLVPSTPTQTLTAEGDVRILFDDNSTMNITVYRILNLNLS